MSDFIDVVKYLFLSQDVYTGFVYLTLNLFLRFTFSKIFARQHQNAVDSYLLKGLNFDDVNTSYTIVFTVLSFIFPTLGVMLILLLIPYFIFLLKKYDKPFIPNSTN